jgi:hypothetical protein
MADLTTVYAAQPVYLPGQSNPMPAGAELRVPQALAEELLANGSATADPPAPAEES